MRISKPGSASNSPRSSALQARRRTLIGDGFRGGLLTPSPATDRMQHYTPAPETVNEPFYQRASTRSARPVSWHPSSQNMQQALLDQHGDGNAMLYPYSAYSDAEMLASLQHFPPTPAVYSGYASPVEPFSPLCLPYSDFGSQPMCSPLSQPAPTPQHQPQQQQQQAFYPVPCSRYSPASRCTETSYLPPPSVADESLSSWDSYPSNSDFFNRPTAPPTPEDFACNLAPSQAAGATAQQQPQQQTKQEAAQLPAYQPLIRDEAAANDSEGEILYGMGLYDAPGNSKDCSVLHESVVLSLLGGSRDQGDGLDTGKGLGLKLEDAWEPPASEDEEEEEEDDDSGDDGEGQDE